MGYDHCEYRHLGHHTREGLGQWSAPGQQGAEHRHPLKVKMTVKENCDLFSKYDHNSSTSSTSTGLGHFERSLRQVLTAVVGLVWTVLGQFDTGKSPPLLNRIPV